MKYIIEAEPKEIAALVLALQEQREETTEEERNALADAIRSVLLEQAKGKKVT